MCTCVVVTGREGVWRLQNFDLDSSDSEVKKKVLSDFPPMQPENQSEFVLVELSLGNELFYTPCPVRNNNYIFYCYKSK